MTCFEIRARSPYAVCLILLIPGILCCVISSMIQALSRHFLPALLLLALSLLLCLPIRGMMHAVEAGVLILRSDAKGLLVDAAHFPTACIPWQNIEKIFLRHVSTDTCLLVCLSDGRELSLHLMRPWNWRMRRFPMPFRFGLRDSQQAPRFSAMTPCYRHFHDRQMVDGILQFSPSHPRNPQSPIAL